MKEEKISGYIKEGKRLLKYDNGRPRKNWVKDFRKKSRMFLKEKCEDCGTKINLTIHHRKPLPKGSKKGKPRINCIEDLNKICLNKDNCQTLCRDCHDKIHEFGIKLNLPRKK